MRVNSIKDLAAAVRGRRKEFGLSQAELAQRVGVSRKWIYEFEGSKPKAEFGLVLRVLDELALALDVSDAVARRPVGVVDLDAVLDEHRDR
jgi:y4mF family transcriptional regulator